MRKIAFLVSHSSPGGAQEIMADLASGFRERGADVRMLALYPTDRAARDSPFAWNHVVPRRPNRPWKVAGLFRALVRWMKAERPDLVVTALPAANVMAAAAARVAGLPGRVVVTHHSPVGTHHRAINAVDTVVGGMRSVRAVVSVSDAVAASLDGKPAGYRAKRRTIHNALPPAVERLIAGLADPAGRHRATGRRVVATGRLAAQKNYAQLIRAAAHLPDVTFDIVGAGPDEAELRGLAAQLGVTERVRFLGFHPRAEALRLLAAGDVFAQVSLFEGHSLALVEAAKLGMPLVVSDVPVQIEGITAGDGERCGIVVPLGDDAALARELARLLDDPAHYAHWAAAARKLATEATFERMMDAYAALQP